MTGARRQPLAALVRGAGGWARTWHPPEGRRKKLAKRRSARRERANARRETRDPAPNHREM